MNHYTNLCKSSKVAAVQQTQETDPEDTEPTVSGFITAIYSDMAITNPTSAKLAVAALRSKSVAPVNSLPLPPLHV